MLHALGLGLSLMSLAAVQIDNEYTQHVEGHGEYYEELMKAFREAGIVVPLTYNDPNQGENFINGTVSRTI